MNKELSGNEIYNYLYNVSDFEIEFKQNESGFSKDMDGSKIISQILKILRIII